MLTENDVRIFLQDLPEVNRVLGKEEFTPEQIDVATKMSAAAYNEMAPFSSYTHQSFPFIYLHLLGTVIHLLKGKILEKQRNRLQHQTDGVVLDEEAAADYYAAMMKELSVEFRAKAKESKIAINIARGWGHVSSPYVSGTNLNV